MENYHNITLLSSCHKEIGACNPQELYKIIVEASPYDKIWGVGLSKNDKRIHDPNNWQGENLLGFVLMEVREALKIMFKF